jgi:hypothetical protein
MLRLYNLLLGLFVALTKERLSVTNERPIEQNTAFALLQRRDTASCPSASMGRSSGLGQIKRPLRADVRIFMPHSRQTAFRPLG